MVNGSCLCGQITFSLPGKQSHMTHCHCSICRKVHGSLFATYVAATDLLYTTGEDKARSYESSSGFKRLFCNTCGSVLPESAPSDAYYVPAGLLDDDPGVRPDRTIQINRAAGFERPLA